MTRARCFALAVVVGVCCLGTPLAFAQNEPAPPPGYGPGYPSEPFETPPPMETTPWYGTADDVEPSLNTFGPRVRVNSWFLRADYLNWNIGNPGTAVLGSPVFGDHVPADTSQPFLIFAPQGNTVLGYGYVPNLGGINLRDNSGVQVTAGVELIDGGQIEVSAFMLARKQSGYTIPLSTAAFFDPSVLLFQQYGIGTGIPGSQALVPQVALTSTLINGSDAGSHLFVYNQSYTVNYQTQLWGGEANYLMDGSPAEILQWLPLIGARYINLTENMSINGLFLDRFNPGSSVLNTSIGSHVMNNLWGGQFGVRAQVVTKYLEFGATPKLLFLGDTSTQTVSAVNFTVPNNGYVADSSTITKFTFGAEVNGFVNVNLTQSFSVRAGYTALWINQVSRAYKNVYYNDTGAGPPISLQTVLHDIFIHGFNFGCEFRF